MHQMMKEGHGDCPVGFMEHWGLSADFYLKQKEALELSEDQVAQLKSLKLTTQKAVIRKEADLRVLKLELKELWGNLKAKRADIEAKAKQVRRLSDELWWLRFKAKLDARDILTPEQRQKVRSLRGPAHKEGGGEEGCSMMGGMEGGASSHKLPSKQ